MRRRSYDAMPPEHEVIKFWPTNPPSRGEIVLVDGMRSQVTRCKVQWENNHWTLLKLRVKPIKEK